MAFVRRSSLLLVGTMVLFRRVGTLYLRFPISVSSLLVYKPYVILLLRSLIVVWYSGKQNADTNGVTDYQFSYHN